MNIHTTSTISRKFFVCLLHSIQFNFYGQTMAGRTTMTTKTQHNNVVFCHYIVVDYHGHYHNYLINISL